MIVRRESTIIDYHAPFDQGFSAVVQTVQCMYKQKGNEAITLYCCKHSNRRDVFVAAIFSSEQLNFETELGGLFPFNN